MSKGKWSEDSRRRAEFRKQAVQRQTPIGAGGDSLFIPNHSGDVKTPTLGGQIANKSYVDTAVSMIAAPEGTAVKSTGEAGGTKFLREDGDGTCSWQTPAGSGDVTAAINLTDETLVQGDGGVKGIKTTTVTAAEVASNTSARHAAVTLNESATTGGLGLSTQEVTFRAATNAQTGYATAAHITAIEANTSASHSAGSDTTLGAMSADVNMNTHKLTNLSAPSSNGDSIRATAKITEAKLEAADDHVNDNTQAHSDYLLNSGADVAAGPLTITADNSTADQAYVPMVLYNTDASPPAASGFPVGTIYIQYTA